MSTEGNSAVCCNGGLSQFFFCKMCVQKSLDPQPPYEVHACLFATSVLHVLTNCHVLDTALHPPYLHSPCCVHPPCASVALPQCPPAPPCPLQRCPLPFCPDPATLPDSAPPSARPCNVYDGTLPAPNCSPMQTSVWVFPVSAPPMPPETPASQASPWCYTSYRSFRQCPLKMCPRPTSTKSVSASTCLKNKNSVVVWLLGFILCPSSHWIHKFATHTIWGE